MTIKAHFSHKIVNYSSLFSACDVKSIPNRESPITQEDRYFTLKLNRKMTLEAKYLFLKKLVAMEIFIFFNSHAPNLTPLRHYKEYSAPAQQNKLSP